MPNLSPLAAKFQRAADVINEADALIITAGAGMGVDSGLPDFRGTEGFWQAYPALAKARLHFQDIANPSAFRAHPHRAWGFYGHRLNLYRSTVPHAGFAILKRIGESMPEGMFVFTSNVDGHFQKAGFSGKRVQECHGSIHHLQCLDGCMADTWPAADFHPQVDEESGLLISDLPRCPYCGEVARPNILMFGDGGWLGHRSELQEANLNAWLRKIERPVVIEIGAGQSIPTVRRFGEERNGFLIRINPTEPDLNGLACMGFRMGGLEVLRGIEGALGS